MSDRPDRSRRTGVASLATLAAVAALSVATPTALTGGAQAAAGHPGRVSAFTPPARPAVRHLSTSVRPGSAAPALTGTLYVADVENQRVVAIAPDGTETSIGSGWSSPFGVALDAAGDLFVADGGSVQEVTPDGTQTTVASGFSEAVGVAVDASGTVFVGDAAANQVISVAPDGSKTVLPFQGLSCPNGIAVDGQGDVFAANYCGGTVSELTAGGVESTVGDGYSGPTGVTTDADGNVYVADLYNNRVEQITPDGVQTTVAASDTGSPTGVEVDADGNVYVADLGGSTFQLTDGTRTVRASDVGGYDVAVLSAPLVAQTIDFTSTAPTAATPGDDYTVGATGGDSGKPVTFSTQTDGVCSVSDNGDGTADVSLDHTGDCVIDADQAGGNGYAAADQAHQTVSVGTLAQAIEFTSDAPSDALPGDGYTVSATGGESGSPVTFSTQTDGVCSVSDNGDGTADVSLDHGGDCVIDADQAAGGDYAAASQAHQTVTVGVFAQDVTFTSTPGTLRTGDDYTATATGGDSGNPVTFAVAPATATSCTVSPTGQVHLLHAKPCTVVASQAGDQDHAAGSAEQTVHVGRAPQVVVFTSKAPRHAKAGDTYHATASGNPAGRVVHLSAIGSCTVGWHGHVRFTHRGTCTLFARQGGNADYTAGQAKQVIAVAAGQGRGPVRLGSTLLG